MLQSSGFISRVLRRQAFTRNVLAVVVDEAHCISHWGASFRKKYSTLGSIRAFLPRGTPVIALTATLTPRVRHDIMRVLNFPKSGFRWLNLGNDRPNVSIVVRACQHPQSSFADLDFVVPANPVTAGDIPKTYIYADDINVGGHIVDHLETILATRSPALAAQGLVRPYNATMSHGYRQAAMAAFRQNPVQDNSVHLPDAPDAESSQALACIRVLVCTDAAGMVRNQIRASRERLLTRHAQGCDVPDVDIVVQWKLPKTFSNFIQRAGRAARASSRTGTAVLLVERTAYSQAQDSDAVPVGDPGKTQSGKASQGKGKGKGKGKVSTRKTRTGTRSAGKEYARAHGIERGGTKKLDSVDRSQEPLKADPDADDEGLLAFVQTTACRRRLWASVFESTIRCTSDCFDCACCLILIPL